MPTKAELEAQLATALRLEAQNLQQQSLLLRAFGNASLFEGTPVEELAPLLRAAHGAGATAAAEAIAKAICSTNDRAENMWSTWALTLRYLPDGDLTRRCLFQILRRWILWENLIPKGELDFRTMYRVLEKLPRDHHTVSVTQTTELTVDNLNNLPAHGHWQRLEDVEWRIRVTNEANEQLCLGIEVRYQGSCEGVMAQDSVHTSSAGAPALWAIKISTAPSISASMLTRGTGRLSRRRPCRPTMHSRSRAASR